MRLCLLLPILLLGGCAMPKWGNKLTTLILPDGRVFKAYVSADGKMEYEDKDGTKWRIDNRGAEPLPEGLARAAAYGLSGSALTATIVK